LKFLLKVSGEIVSSKSFDEFINVLNDLQDKGHEISIVVGGGNYIRGRDYKNNREKVDRIGIYSTLMNGLMLDLHLKNSVVINSFESDLLEKKTSINNEIKIFTGGLGLPYFSTDTAAVLRALEIGASLILKATKVSGVYDKDPKDTTSKKYDQITFEEIIEKKLDIIDYTAASLAIGRNIKMVVFDGRDPQNIYKAIDLKLGTVINNGNN
jgi:uridylate kinase